MLPVGDTEKFCQALDLESIGRFFFFQESASLHKAVNCLLTQPESLSSSGLLLLKAKVSQVHRGYHLNVPGADGRGCVEVLTRHCQRHGLPGWQQVRAQRLGSKKLHVSTTQTSFPVNYVHV